MAEVKEVTADDLTNRFSYHPPQDEETVKQHERARATVLNTAYALEALLPNSREKSLATTKLEEALFWANAAIARNK